MSAMRADAKIVLERQRRLVPQLRKRGVRILAAVTKLGGEIMGMGDELGQIKPGYLADLVLVRGDPTRDVTLLQEKRNLLAIMKDGREVLEQFDCRSYPDPIGSLIILVTCRGDLPSLSRRKLCAKISETAIHICIRPLALDELEWAAPFRNHEVDLAPVDIAKIAEIQFSTCGVLLEVHPLEEMASDQILEAHSFVRNERPIQGSEFGEQIVHGVVNVPLSSNSAVRVAGSLDDYTGVERDNYHGQNSARGGVRSGVSSADNRLAMIVYDPPTWTRTRP